MGLVDGKVCLVTGGASNPGLGHAIAHKLASEGGYRYRDGCRWRRR